MRQRYTSRRCRAVVNTVAVNAVRPMLGLPVRVRVVGVPVRVFVVITNVQAHAGGLNALVADDEHQAEEGFGAGVQDAVEDGLRVGVEDIAAFAETPGDGVEEPDEQGQDATAEEDLVDVAAESLGVLATRYGERVDDPQEGGAAERVVAPLIPRPYQSADQAGDDHDFVEEDGVQDGWPRHASSQE